MFLDARDDEKPTAPYQSHFSKSELEDKIVRTDLSHKRGFVILTLTLQAKLTEELQDLRSRSARKVAEMSELDSMAVDVSMVTA